MAENKNALLGALTESEDILNKISNNIKGMLATSLQEQVSSQLSEDFDNEEEEEEVATELPVDGDNGVNAEETEDGEAEGDVEISLDAEPEGGEEVSTDDTIDSVEGGEEVSTELPAEISVDEPVDDNLSDVVSDVVDATNLSDDELISVFKKVTDNTEIEVVKTDDNTIEISKDGQEYVIKLNEDKESFLNSVLSGDNGSEEVSTEPIADDAVEGGEEEVVFEIVLDGSEEPQNNEDELEERRTHAVGRSQVGKPEGFLKYASSRLRQSLRESVDVESKQLITENETLRVEKDNLLTENVQLKDELNKHKDGLVKMHQCLSEALVLNQKIFHINKLFCEHSTSLEEKKSILERFDGEEIKDEKDIQNLYKTVSNELKTTLKESVENKINTNVGSTGASMLTESKQNEDMPGLERMKKLMNIKNK